MKGPDVELQHLSFGAVLRADGEPYKTRSGDTVGLEGLLDEAGFCEFYQQCNVVKAETESLIESGRDHDADRRG